MITSVVAALCLAVPSGGAAGGPRQPPPEECRQVVRHGRSRVELRIVRSDGGRECSVEVRVRAPGRKPFERTWNRIEPVGSRYGAALSPRRAAGLVAIAKYGDYDGRLLLVDREGEVFDLAGPEHVTVGRFVLVRHHSDVDGVTVFDAERRKVTFAAEGLALSDLLGFGEREDAWKRELVWVQRRGEVWLVALPPAANGHEVLLPAARLDLDTGTLLTATFRLSDGPWSLMSGWPDDAWIDCRCPRQVSKVR